MASAVGSNESMVNLKDTIAVENSEVRAASLHIHSSCLSVDW